MKHGSLFSGIGGFDLAAEWMGWDNRFHCEWNLWARTVLDHYWPNAESFTDITKTDFTKYANIIDILTGGFPCQPYSSAGKRKGKEDSRHLWPEMLRAIREIEPVWVVGENVYGLLSWSKGLVFHEIIADLETAFYNTEQGRSLQREGYKVFPVLLPACGINAPHKRYRIWFVAYSHAARQRRQQRERENERDGNGTIANPNNGSGQEYGLSARGEMPEKCSDGSGAPPHSSGNRWQRTREGVEIEKGLQPRSQSAGELEGGFEGLRCERVTSNANGNGCHSSHSSHEINSGEGGEYAQHDSQQMHEQRIIAHSNGIRGHENDRERNREPDEFNKNGTSTKWENFPTQSPICSGDDGISSRLDGITFSKWRTESINGYGNAIVPGVALQLYKVIEEMQQIIDSNPNMME